MFSRCEAKIMQIPNEAPQKPPSTGTPAIVRLVIGIGGALLALLVVATLGFALTGRIIIGSGNVKSESRSVSGFNQVELDGTGDLTIQQTGTESLTIQAEDNILPLITSNVSDGRLTIGMSALPFGIFIPRKPIHYLLTVSDLNDVSLAGSGSVTIDSLTASNLSVNIGGSGVVAISQLRAPNVHLSVGGSGTIKIADLTATTLNAAIGGSGSMSLAGQTQQQTITIGGSGSYQAGNLTSAEAAINVGGSGSASVDVTNTLNVSIGGSGSVTYCGGNPAVTQHISGSGSLQHC
jgi:hypothetical protein